jgi:hypothetical protein
MKKHCELRIANCEFERQKRGWGIRYSVDPPILELVFRNPLQN